jgi:hypothetical protein
LQRLPGFDDPPTPPIIITVRAIQMSNSDRITGREAAAIVGLNWPGQFNSARTRLERVRRRDTDRVEPYPRDFSLLAQQAQITNAHAERTWRRDQILVVPEWGGVSILGGDWSYSRAACERWRNEIGGSNA